ncbi:sodium:proton antiporter [Mesorhizobium sp. L-8-10]|uniref:cation:proton antiporter n=1 Tax=Mesorhizobium sp. L-8-10 TaxID=2744523 RepID=UPI00192624EF|nr:sodium:proton antiporter [Mesorhizobium sp. L-8-10]BCH32012.1 sodium:proton antiporter [Mesorhizobium sp. L-8-10]
MVSIFEIAALLLTLSAIFGWINLRFFKLPHTIGLLLMGLASSIFLLGMHRLLPDLGIGARMTHAIGSIDFYSTIMDGMLAFLLFAGALHVDLRPLKNQKWAIALMASIGVVISTVVIAVCLWLAARALGFQLSMPWALVFGALISPTDPVAVLSLLKSADVPESIEAKIAGESLFNDGVAVVAFSALLAFALGSPDQVPQDLSFDTVSEVLAEQAPGAALFGLATGWIACRAMAAINDRIVEILISLGVCVATYAVCLRYGMSGPIAVVVAGLLIGSRAGGGISMKAKDHLFAFWEVIDEILNSVLFLLIGLEVLVLHFQGGHLLLVLAAIPIVLFGRLVSVTVPISLLSFRQKFAAGAIPILTWGGLRGGVSVALALSLPDSEAKPTILAVTYGVVLFSIIVQGLTVKHLVARTLKPA